MAGEPTSLYGSQRGSHYQGQMSTLSKHFRLDNRPDQATFSRGQPSASNRRPPHAEPTGAPASPGAEQPRLESL